MFELKKTEGKARRGVFTCAHGTVQTPVFMNVGTQGAIKGAAKREYEAKKGIVSEEAPEKETMSGVKDRPYCKGRNYDPNRYGKTEE